MYSDFKQYNKRSSISQKIDYLHIFDFVFMSICQRRSSFGIIYIRASRHHEEMREYMQLTKLFKQLDEKDINGEITKSLSHQIAEIIKKENEMSEIKELHPNTELKPWNRD
jgi:hypothetical protein